MVNEGGCVLILMTDAYILIALFEVNGSQAQIDRVGQDHDQ
jgi:hypothetical protein